MSELTALRRELKAIAAEQEWMRSLLAANGIEGPWMSPQQAATALGKGRSAVMDDIKMAESKRIAKQRWPMRYGKHYRNDGKQEKPCWKICLPKYQEFVNIPPDQLPAA